MVGNELTEPNACGHYLFLINWMVAETRKPVLSNRIGEVQLLVYLF